MAITKYDLDINKQAIIKPVVILRQGDHDIDTMHVSLSVANEPMDLTGATVTFMGNTANGRQIIDDAHVKIIDTKSGVFEYVFPSEASSDIGEYKVAYFSIIQANGQSSTMDFRVQVLSGVDISAPVASEYIAHYDTMVSNLNSAYESATHETNEKMASTVSSLATSAATVLDSALARVNDIDSTANNASSAASKAVSMASSVASAVTSQASYINSVASSAASNVSSVAASVVDKLNNISVGGRNLLLGTADWSGGSDRWNYRGVQPNGTYRGTVIASTSREWISPMYLVQNAGILHVGKTYAFSTYVRNTSDTDTVISYYYDASIINPSTTVKALPAHTDWTRVSGTFTVIKDPTTSYLGLRWESQKAVTNGQIQFAGYKLEEGNVATDWTPAPEDADSTYVKKSGDTMTGGLKGGVNTLPSSGDLNNLTATGKYYQNLTVNTSNWNNRPSNSPLAAFGVDVISNDVGTTITQTFYVHAYSRMWVRALWKSGSAMQSSPWVEIADDANVVHKTGNETVAGDKMLTGKLSAANFEAGGDKYTDTASVDVNYLGATISFVRIGKLVTFTSGVSSFNVGVSAGLTSGVIPNGFKPAVQQNISPANQSGASNFFSFDQGGGIYSYGTYPSGAQPRLSWTYITTDPWPSN